MESLGLIAGMINLCVGVFVSVRILLVARRTKGVPEIFLYGSERRGLGVAPRSGAVPSYDDAAAVHRQFAN